MAARHAFMHWRRGHHYGFGSPHNLSESCRRIVDGVDARSRRRSRSPASIRIVNEESRQPVEFPTVEALREDRTVKLASHSLLIAKDGTERSISDSAAPITNDKGEVAGVVLVFRDITDRRKAERAADKSLAYADDIIATLREPFVVLDSDLRVKTANRSFYDKFQVTKEETENRLVYDFGNGQWDIPGLRKLLDEVLSRNQSVHDFEVEHSFPELGRKTMLLNARPFPPDSKSPELILLAMEDVSAVRTSGPTNWPKPAATKMSFSPRWRTNFEILSRRSATPSTTLD